MGNPTNYRENRVLLVEDEAVLALLTRRILERAGYEVVVVTTGEKAVSVSLDQRDFGLILMDIDLGSGIDGTEAAQQILQEIDIPILFLSSHTEPEIVAKTELITNYGYVVKNSSPTVLLASMKMAHKLHVSFLELQKAEDTITLERDNLLAILDGSPIAMLLIRETCQVLQANPLASSYCWYNPADPSDIRLKPEFASVETDVVTCLRSGKAIPARELKLGHSSAPSYFRYTISPVHRDQESGPTVLLTLENISDIRAEQERILTLSHIAENSGSMVIITDKEGRIEWVNEAFTDLTGYQLPEIRGEFPGKLLQGPDPDPILNKLIFDRLNAGLDFSGDILNFTKNGTPYWISMNIQPVKDPSGSIQQYVSVQHDITEQKRIENHLRDQQEKTSAVLKAMSQGIAILGKDGEVTYVNPAYQRAFPVPEGKDILGTTNYLENLHPEEGPRLLPLIYGAIQEQATTARFIYRYKNPDGNYHWREDQVTFFYDDQGKLTESFVMAQPITLFEPNDIYFE